jgi:L-asparaginase / beta-aspartyl-peptidase
MPRGAMNSVLIVHGGAGARATLADRPGRRHALLEAVSRGATILREGGGALDAVTAAVAVLEDDPLFNAGYGSVLTADGTVEMDAGLMTAERTDDVVSPEAKTSFRRKQRGSDAVRSRAGGVVMVTRVGNPILLARAVMEHTPHVLLGGAGAEAIARRAGIKLCRPVDLISQRARDRWVALNYAARRPETADSHGTVGAVAMDYRGNLAAATSTGGMAGKLTGRIGDSAIIGAGFFATNSGAASATGTGEAILRMASCREAVRLMPRLDAAQATAQVVADLRNATEHEVGLIAIDRRCRIGFAHNAAAMEIAMLEAAGTVRHLAVPRLAR